MDYTVNTSFGTYLRPINSTEGLFRLTSSYECKLDTPIADKMGTKKLFTENSIVTGNLWEEYCPKSNKQRKVVMVQEGIDGRYLIPKNKLEPTTQAEIDALKAKKELEDLNGKVDNLIENAQIEAEQLIEESPSGFLDKEYLGFTGKQILAASLGAIILIKIFK